MRHMRDLKETLFADGKVIFRHEGRNITVVLRDIERTPDVRDFLKTLTQAYDHCLTIVRDDASARHRREISAVAVGGGAFAPFIQDLIKKKSGGKPRVTPRPVTPAWASGPAFGGNLAAVFPQLAIAIGGALAPDGMLAAHSSGLSPLEDDRSDIPAARD
jgi:hypothetical protein